MRVDVWKCEVHSSTKSIVEATYVEISHNAVDGYTATIESESTYMNGEECASERCVRKFGSFSEALQWVSKYLVG